MAKYDIILQNNSDKRFFILSGVTESENTNLWLKFDNIELPKKAVDGEYTYALIENSLSGAVYDTKSSVWDTIVTVSGVSLSIKDLRPLVGLLRVGDVKEKNAYKEKNNVIYYQK